MLSQNKPIFNTFSPQSRVWIYLANRDLKEAEVQAIQPVLDQFSQKWASHNRQLKAGADVLYNRAIVLMVDETQAGASGCSIDSSVHFLQGLGNELGVSFFERFAFGVQTNEQIKFMNKEELKAAYDSNEISDETLVFDNLVSTKEALDAQAWKPLKDSWLKRMV
ncbi:MAG: hypothetical protein R2879_04125 [Saprospiraceae bacterium]